jgi:hypothetical protein
MVLPRVRACSRSKVRLEKAQRRIGEYHRFGQIHIAVLRSAALYEQGFGSSVAGYSQRTADTHSARCNAFAGVS